MSLNNSQRDVNILTFQYGRTGVCQQTIRTGYLLPVFSNQPVHKTGNDFLRTFSVLNSILFFKMYFIYYEYHA